MAVDRINADDARRAVTSGRALLVCGYEDEAKCRPIMLEGAIPFAQLAGREGSLDKDQSIIFYCA